jgi:hypothetical protein
MKANLKKETIENLIKEFEKSKKQLTSMKNLNKTLQEQYDKLISEKNWKNDENIQHVIAENSTNIEPSNLSDSVEKNN